MNRAVAEILAQHNQLRSMMDRCEQLADQVDAGRESPEPLARAIVELRVAFDHHLRVEEDQLRPLLRDAQLVNDVRIDRAVAEHVHEHRVMAQRFMPGPTAELRETLASLRDHLENEERYFLHRLRPEAARSQGMREHDGSGQ